MSRSIPSVVTHGAEVGEGVLVHLRPLRFVVFADLVRSSVSRDVLPSPFLLWSSRSVSFRCATSWRAASACD